MLDMKQSRDWMKHLTPLLQRKADRPVDVFGNPMPTDYEVEKYPKAARAWIESRDAFRKTHANVDNPPPVKCDDAFLKCTWPNCKCKEV